MLEAHRRWGGGAELSPLSAAAACSASPSAPLTESVMGWCLTSHEAEKIEKVRIHFERCPVLLSNSASSLL